MGSDRRGRLAGRTIVVTRRREQAGELVGGLEREGADVIVSPAIQIVAPTHPEELRSMARSAGRFDWIVFTSANGVERFWAALEAEGLDTRALEGVSLCSIGDATSRAMARYGARPDLVPREYVAESLVEAFQRRGGLEGKRVLLPRAEAAREVLPEALTQLGALVTDVAAYRTVAAEPVLDTLPELLRNGSIDFVTFTSSSSVRSFARTVSGDLGRARVATIGPITSRTVRELGWTVAVEAREHTSAGLCSALVDHVLEEERKRED